MTNDEAIDLLLHPRGSGPYVRGSSASEDAKVEERRTALIQLGLPARRIAEAEKTVELTRIVAARTKLDTEEAEIVARPLP